ncbi:ABC transporter ATP-binding protein [Bosea sp. F3-2]|uniref:ABC transporter ATP-binding protein n=1 Tax=Bosea sp. F3-2 TaxID=2599640 RepID=UPI0011EC022C|nr:ABC transporter ATP-binding protein [Bosea sp. F3-2]QEL21612.1 ABC transporter ATP-binding protein [Bosea sp. F3-2]
MTIRLEQVTKSFPGAAQAAVDRLDLTVETGRLCVLIGPSGCGKTTTMRMINRLIEPSSGRILVGDRDVAQADPVELRRHIGYVIQHVGLFPHMTIAENVATVPKLLGWDTARIRARSEEMLELVGLDPAQYLPRYPRHLSGGQRQRVGVARALAADPPVMLMDEPFGAVDPILRSRLQEEFLAIQKRLRKTVIFVTHDIDEAIRMGDVVAIMRDGKLVQYDTPDRLLAAPADDFVADFVGADRALRRLSLVRAADAVEPGRAPGSFTLPDTLSLRGVLSALLAEGRDAATIVDENGHVQGQITLAALRARSAGRSIAGSDAVSMRRDAV